MAELVMGFQQEVEIFYVFSLSEGTLMAHHFKAIRY